SSAVRVVITVHGGSRLTNEAAHVIIILHGGARLTEEVALGGAHHTTHSTLGGALLPPWE
ncbi:hypothetical protein HAX54_047782, partial [Datura stramonium]|nr:hypothetical protein [Datura stramonium]